MAHAGKRLLQCRDVLLQRGHALVRDRSGAHPAGAPGLAGGAGHLRRPGVEFRKRPVLARLVPIIGGLGAAARLDAGQAFVDVGNKADAAHLAIGDDVDAGIGLTPHGLGDGALDARRERRLVDRLAALLPQDHRPQIVGPRQAADMRRQNAIGAAFHDFLPAICRSLARIAPARSFRPKGRPTCYRIDDLLTSLPEAEIGEDYVEQVLDIGPAGDPAEAAPREAQILGAQFRQSGGERAAQRGGGFLQRLAMPGARQQRRGAVVAFRNARRQRRDQLGNALPGQRRNGDRAGITPSPPRGRGSG